MRRVSILPGVIVLLLSSVAMSLTSDREQPINIEADTLEIDDSRHISIYQGNVDMRQGSLHIRAERIILHFDQNNNLQWLEISGSPAAFSLLNDNRQPMSGEARNIDYHQDKSLMKMRGDAVYRNDQDSIESDSITVNLDTDALQAGDQGGNGRVRMLIQPKNSPANP